MIISTYRFTVPVLWDKQKGMIVNNESSEIIRIFNSEFNDIVSPEKAKLDLYPTELRKDIDEINAWVYDTVNSGYPIHQCVVRKLIFLWCFRWCLQVRFCYNTSGPRGRCKALV